MSDSAAYVRRDDRVLVCLWTLALPVEAVTRICALGECVVLLLDENVEEVHGSIDACFFCEV